MRRYRSRAAIAISLLATMAGGCSWWPVGHDHELASRLDPILHRLSSSGATVSARVMELPSGRELYAVDVDAPRMPASNMKLVTSAAALDLFGPDHAFETYLAFDGQNLWLIGTGDPAVGDPRIAKSHNLSPITVLQDWAQELRERGITRIPGHLYYYDGALESRQIHPTWDEDDLVHWYAAPVSGLCFNDNCVDITISPAEDGKPAEVEVMPPVQNIVVINQCVSGENTPPSIARVPYADTYIIGGGCQKRRALKSKPVGDPGAFFADALRTQLAVAGVSIDGEIRSAPTPLDGVIPPPADKLVGVHESQMADVLWRVNKSSQNLFAECLCKLTGQAYDALEGRIAPGSWASGERAARAFLRRHRIDDREFAMADGSGLSRDNRVTTRLITDLLATMFDHPSGEAFRDSLAVPGQTGTLRGRMKGITGRVVAKTGYIRGVRALSGYVHTHQDRWLCFSIIFNDIPGSVKPYQALQDETCGVLVDWPGAQ